jgi:hypothetical protein
MPACTYAAVRGTGGTYILRGCSRWISQRACVYGAACTADPLFNPHLYGFWADQSFDVINTVIAFDFGKGSWGGGDALI